MNKSLTVSCSDEHVSTIEVSYKVEATKDQHTISCSVNQADTPAWLQMRKFEMTSKKMQNGFVPLFVEENNSRNMATTLFIDEVYSAVMKAERCKIVGAN